MNSLINFLNLETSMASIITIDVPASNSSYVIRALPASKPAPAHTISHEAEIGIERKRKPMTKLVSNDGGCHHDDDLFTIWSALAFTNPLTTVNVSFRNRNGEVLERSFTFNMNTDIEEFGDDNEDDDTFWSIRIEPLLKPLIDESRALRLAELCSGREDSVTYEPLGDAVELQCGHIFNKTTLQKLDKENRTSSCPNCRASFRNTY